jgi:two-component system NtrC family sensor kinase
LKGAHYNILGTFLGHEFSFRNHNIIFIISRNDFLPQENFERTEFSQLTKRLPLILNKLLRVQKIDDDIKKITNIFKSFPNKIQVYNKKEQTYLYGQKELDESPLVFSNNEYEIKVNAKNDFDFIHKEKILLLGDLLNTLRHELANPLFGLKLSAELFDNPNLDEDSLELISQIAKSVDHSSLIIENFSNLFTNDQQQLVSLKDLINEVFVLSKSESRSIIKELVIEEDDIKMKCNGTFLFQILFNLIINSSQALNKHTSDKPTIKIVIRQNSYDVTIDIFDNGPGIDTSLQESVFLPFFTTKEKGTGLGLAISYSLAKKINGELKLIKSNSKGTHFKLTIKNENTNS